MFTRFIKLAVSSLLFSSSLTISAPTQAATFVIDNFTDFQSITDIGTGAGTSSAPLALSAAASDLTGIERTLLATATGGGFGNQEIIVGEPGGPGTGGLLAISNNTYSAGTALITWDNFATINFTAFANAILLEVVAIDLNVAVEMIVNGASTSGLQAFAGSGNFFVDFSTFSDPNAFDAVTQFQLIFTGPVAWDGQFRLLAAETTTVPEPSTLLLMGFGAISLRTARKRINLGHRAA